MKKIFILLALPAAVTVMAQESSPTNENPRNEVKANLVYPFFGAAELSFERHLTNRSSIGISGATAFTDLDLSLGLTPYYRYYFGKKPNAGFFVEANSAFVWGKPYRLNDFTNQTEDTRKAFGFGMGVAVGYKHVTSKNFVFEAYGGAGKFFNNDLSNGAYPRFGLSIGKRF